VENKLNRLESLAQFLSEKRGRKVSLEEALDFLLELLQGLIAERENLERQATLLRSLLIRCGLLEINDQEITLEKVQEAASRLWPVPPETAEKLSQKAKEYQAPTLAVFREVLEIGLAHAGRISYTFPTDLEKRVRLLMTQLPQDKKKEMFSSLERAVEVAVKKSLAAWEKKAKKLQAKRRLKVKPA